MNMAPRQKVAKLSTAVMSASKDQRSSFLREKVPQRRISSSPNHDHSYDDADDGSIGGGVPMVKDESENQLEKLLFGDPGFQDALRDHEVASGDLDQAPAASSEPELFDDERGSDEDMAHLDDADVSSQYGQCSRLDLSGNWILTLSSICPEK